MKIRLVISLFVAVTLVGGSLAQACTRALWNNDLGVFVSRTMDWPSTTEPVLTVFPRGMKRNGGKVGEVQLIKENPHLWTSKYASLVTTIYGVGTADGFNERGLAAHMLYFTPADFGARDPKIPGIQAGLLAQYLLDNAATVSEALAQLEGVQPVMMEAHGHKATIHLAIEDANGDSAIIEYIDGKRTVHHGREFRIMTNAPAYGEHLAWLKTFDFSNPSSDTVIPGNVNAKDRFVRASYYLDVLPEPKTQAEAVASSFAIARNISVPFGAPYKDVGTYNTEYRTVADLTNKRYYFELTTSPNVIWVNLAAFNLESGASVMMLDPNNPKLSGDVSSQFVKAAAPF